jgi:hypothetical protein
MQRFSPVREIRAPSFLSPAVYCCLITGFTLPEVWRFSVLLPGANDWLWTFLAKLSASPILYPTAKLSISTASTPLEQG